MHSNNLFLQVFFLNSSIKYNHAYNSPESLRIRNCPAIAASRRVRPGRGKISMSSFVFSAGFDSSTTGWVDLTSKGINEVLHRTTQ